MKGYKFSNGKVIDLYHPLFSYGSKKLLWALKMVFYMVCDLEPHCPLENHSAKLASTQISNEELTLRQDFCSGVDSHGPPCDTRRGSF